MRPIDADEVKKQFPIMENDFGMVINETLHKELDRIPTVEAIPKADYENRLKADMVAMLEDLKSYIELMANLETDPPFAEGEKYCADIIQQKINSLKENPGEEIC